jgi:iron complex transport system ATP-binding protein
MVQVILKSVKLSLNGDIILRGVNLTIRKGEFFGIVGQNGSGKTSLLRTIAKYYPKDGLIYLDGRELDEISLRELARFIGVVPQEFELSIRFKTEEFVALGRIPHIRFFESKKDLEVVEKVISYLDCPRGKLVCNLSGGEKQRVLIAKALAQEPKLLLLDEPTSHLDLKHQIEVVKILRRLARTGLTVIATFHDLNLALNFCDRIAIMKEGKILKVCTPDEVDANVLRFAFDVDLEIAEINGWRVVVPKV